MKTEYKLDDEVQVRVAGGLTNGWLDGKIVQLNPIKVKLDCDGYIVSGGNPRTHIRPRKS